MRRRSPLRFLARLVLVGAIALFFIVPLAVGGCTPYHNGLLDTVEALNKRQLSTCGEVNGAVAGGVANGSMHLIFGTGGMTPVDCRDVLE